ncbi:MAG: CRISPR system precrRNA processing endoribonuclease RAMP protein Cas6 [Desulfurococcaceae archaeon]
MKRYAFRVVVALTSNSRGGNPGSKHVFTGKLVKSLLIDGNPRLKPFFEKTMGSAPKLVHVSPLYVEKVEDGRLRVKCLHTVEHALSFNRHVFYVGFAETETGVSPSLDDVYEALLNLSGRHRFASWFFNAELVSAELVDVEKEADKAVEHLVKSGKIRVVFASPTLLRDPFRAGKYKSLVPTVMNIFSTPVYVNLYTEGRLSWRNYVKTLLVIHRLLSEPYSVHSTTRVVHVKYEENKKPTPALIGYVNLYLNKHYHDHYTTRGVNPQHLLREAFATMLTLGTGTSRATGFGHTTITSPSGIS